MREILRVERAADGRGGSTLLRDSHHDVVPDSQCEPTRRRVLDREQFLAVPAASTQTLRLNSRSDSVRKRPRSRIQMRNRREFGRAAHEPSVDEIIGAAKLATQFAHRQRTVNRWNGFFEPLEVAAARP